MKEHYVSFKVAKLLKEKGFDWECSTYLYTINVYNYGVEPCRFQINDSKNSELASDKMTAPTQQMACDWLREEHEIDIIPVIRHSLKYAQESPFRDYACRVYDCDGNIVLSATKWYSRYENAVEAALEYSLKNLI